MKNKKLPVIILFAFFIGIGIVKNKKSSTANTSDKSSHRIVRPKEKQKQTERTSMENSNTTSTKVNRNITPLEFKNFSDSLPTQEAMKKEAQASPHFTPESLINFAKQLGPLMEKALNNVMDAEVFSEELQDCAMDEAVVPSARATCVTSIERLANRYPELNEKAEMIKANVAPDVRKLLKNRDKILKR